MKREYGNRRTNIEGRNRVTQLWLTRHVRTPPCISWRQTGAWREKRKKPGILKHVWETECGTRSFHEHLNKSETGRPQRGGQTAAHQHRASFAHANVGFVWVACQTESSPAGPPPNQNPQHTSTLFSFYPAFRSVVAPLLAARSADAGRWSSREETRFKRSQRRESNHVEPWFPNFLGFDPYNDSSSPCAPKYFWLECSCAPWIHFKGHIWCKFHLF